MNYSDHGQESPTFKFVNQGDMFAVCANWNGRERRIVTGEIKGNVFVIENFLYSVHLTLKQALTEAAKKAGRTLAGMVMETIKQGLPDDAVLQVEDDDWAGKQGPQTLKSPDLQKAAQSMLIEPGATTNQPAKDYLDKRYERLYPTDAAKERMPKRLFLTNIQNHGWYGAWLPESSTAKESIISTACTFNRLRCNFF